MPSRRVVRAAVVLAVAAATLAMGTPASAEPGDPVAAATFALRQAREDQRIARETLRSGPPGAARQAEQTLRQGILAERRAAAELALALQRSVQPPDPLAGAVAATRQREALSGLAAAQRPSADRLAQWAVDDWLALRAELRELAERSDGPAGTVASAILDHDGGRGLKRLEAERARVRAQLKRRRAMRAAIDRRLGSAQAGGEQAGGEQAGDILAALLGILRDLAWDSAGHSEPLQPHRLDEEIALLEGREAELRAQLRPSQADLVARSLLADLEVQSRTRRAAEATRLMWKAYDDAQRARQLRVQEHSLKLADPHDLDPQVAAERERLLTDANTAEDTALHALQLAGLVEPEGDRLPLVLETPAPEGPRGGGSNGGGAPPPPTGQLPSPAGQVPSPAGPRSGPEQAAAGLPALPVETPGQEQEDVMVTGAVEKLLAPTGIVAPTGIGAAAGIGAATGGNVVLMPGLGIPPGSPGPLPALRGYDPFG